MCAAVTEDIISNLIKSNLSHLKTFAELLNAEFTEEGHDESNREKFKDDVSRVLDRFGSAEADFQKTVASLTATKNELINEPIHDVGEEECNPRQLMKEVDDIINIFEGKSRSNDPDPVFEEFDENRIVHQLERVEDILSEFNPLKFRDDDDNGEDEERNEEEEQRMCTILEQFQKKHMKKHDTTMEAADEDDENAMEVDQADESSTTEDEDEAENAQASQRPSTSNTRAKKEMDEKLKSMWKNYQRQISNIELKPLKEIYDRKLSETPLFPKDRLTHYPKFSRSILELFSHEAVVVCGGKQNYIDPFTKTPIQHPIQNKKCDHVYEKETVVKLINKKKEMGCPNVGCAVRFTIHDLEEDEELTQKVTQSLNERQDLQQSTNSINDIDSFAENMVNDLTDDEYENDA